MGLDPKLIENLIWGFFLLVFAGAAQAMGVQ